jgi:drug/metabolite transporter (DMT)-like permease
MSDSPMLRARVLIPFTIATIIWGTTWIVIRDQLGTVPPTWSVAYRFTAGAVVMFLYALATRSPLNIGRRGQMFAALFGLAQFAMNFNFVYRAEGYITSGLVAVLFALLIVPNAVLGRIFLKQPLSGRFLIGSVVAVTGVGMLIAQELRVDAAGTTATILGTILTLAGVLSASAANIIDAGMGDGLGHGDECRLWFCDRRPASDAMDAGLYRRRAVPRRVCQCDCLYVLFQCYPCRWPCACGLFKHPHADPRDDHLDGG